MISIVGPPAAGKTTLAEAMARLLPAELIREDYKGNPFLADSYGGQSQSLLPGQLYFLMSRVGQLSAASWPHAGLAVSDYGFLQDRIFACARLGSDDLRLYDRIARRVEGLVRPPDVLIHLEAPEQVLLERIAARGRKFESSMTAEFLSALKNAYNEAVAGAKCPVIRVDCQAVDLRQPPAVEGVTAQVRKAL